MLMVAVCMKLLDVAYDFILLQLYFLTSVNISQMQAAAAAIAFNKSDDHDNNSTGTD